MSPITPVTITQVQTATGLWPAQMSLWRAGAEHPLASLDVRVPDPGTLPTGWAKPVVGITGSSEATFNDINAQVGPVLIRRTYNTTLPPSWAASNAASDVAAGRESYWSWKPSVTSFPTSATQRAAFSAFLDTIPAGHPTIIAAWHEPEDDIEAGSYTLAQWAALQEAVGTIIKSKNRPELRFSIVLMGQWTFDTRSGRTAWNWLGLVPWDLVDVVGIDPYRTVVGTSTSMETLLTVNNSGTGTGGSAPSTMQVLESWGKPVSLAEWGTFSSTAASNATFIADAYAWMKRWNQSLPVAWIESAVWFHLTTDNSLLEGAAISAYAAIVADSKIPPA